MQRSHIVKTVISVSKSVQWEYTEYMDGLTRSGFSCRSGFFGSFDAPSVSALKPVRLWLLINPTWLQLASVAKAQTFPRIWYTTREMFGVSVHRTQSPIILFSGGLRNPRDGPCRTQLRFSAHRLFRQLFRWRTWVRLSVLVNSSNPQFPLGVPSAE